jgi:hypothetical protein
MNPMLRISLLASALWLAGCAAGGGGTKPSGEPAAKAGGKTEKVVEQRAVARWALLTGGKLAEAYDFLSPGFRALKTREQYATDMQNRPVRWKAARFKTVECPPPGEFCDVTMDVDYEMESTLPGVGTLKSTAPVVERWIALDGVWYLVPKEVARN